MNEAITSKEINKFKAAFKFIKPNDPKLEAKPVSIEKIKASYSKLFGKVTSAYIKQFISGIGLYTYEEIADMIKDNIDVSSLKEISREGQNADMLLDSPKDSIWGTPDYKRYENGMHFEHEDIVLFSYHDLDNYFI